MNKTEQRKLQQFFSLLGLSTSAKFTSSFTKSGMKSCQSLDDALFKNERGFDVYFVVNPSKSFKREGVTDLLTNFVDLDAGKAENGDVLSTSKVTTFKIKALGRISKFSVKPTYVVETRNGFHVYWVSNEPMKASAANRSIWKSRQNGIFNFFKDFGADKAVQKENQLMRVPYSFWHKSWAQKKAKKESFLTVIHPASTEKKIDSEKLPSLKTSPDGGEKISYEKPTNVSAILDAALVETIGNNVRKAIQSKPESAQSTANSSSHLSQEDLTQLAEFLGDVSAILWAKGCKFLAKQATTFKDRIIFG